MSEWTIIGEGKTELYYWNTDKVTAHSVYIADGVESIGIIFAHHGKNLTRLSLPSSLKRVESSVCSEAYNLEKIEFRGGYPKDLKLGQRAFLGLVTGGNATDVLFSMDVPDEFRVYIFTKLCNWNTKYLRSGIVVRQDKADAVFAYLSGAPASGKFESSLVRFAKKEYKDLFLYLFVSKHDDLLDAFLDILTVKDKNGLERIDELIRISQAENMTDIELHLRTYKEQHFAKAAVQKAAGTQKMKDLGLMDRTVADWKKIFKLKDLGDGYMITKYLDTAPDVIIPEHIGKKPVISIDRGVFSESNITSLESPVAPYLSDFFGWDVFPTLRIYGKDDSKKKYRVVPIESAKPDQFVSFGKYPQEWKDSVLRPIIWRVLERTENEMLLSSRFPSEYLPMLAKRESVIWEKTDLRKWLNELFYDVAFSHNEKDRIVTVRNENPPNPQYSVGGGTTTEDKVFLLSLDELTAFGCVSKDTDITDHATASGTVGGGWLWSCWLRTNGKTANRFALRHLDNLDGEFCDKPNYVHPVIRIKL